MLNKSSGRTSPRVVMNGAQRVLVATTAMLAFISFWRAAAIVLNDMGSSAFYAGAISEHFVGKTAPWFILAIMLLFYAVRALAIFFCARRHRRRIQFSRQLFQHFREYFFRISLHRTSRFPPLHAWFTPLRRLAMLLLGRSPFSCDCTLSALITASLTPSVIEDRPSHPIWLRKLSRRPLPAWLSQLWDYFLFARDPPTIIGRFTSASPAQGLSLS